MNFPCLLVFLLSEPNLLEGVSLHDCFPFCKHTYWMFSGKSAPCSLYERNFDFITSGLKTIPSNETAKSFLFQFLTLSLIKDRMQSVIISKHVLYELNIHSASISNTDYKINHSSIRNTAYFSASGGELAALHTELCQDIYAAANYKTQLGWT